MTYEELKNTCVSWILVIMEPMTFEELIEVMNIYETNIQKQLSSHGKTMEDFKKDVLKSCYELLKEWNARKPLKRSENEYWIRSFNKVIKLSA